MKLMLLCAVACLLTACVTVPPAVSEAKKAQYDASIPTCTGEADCKAKWEAAQLWVVHNAGWKIQTATDVLIETFNPPRGDTRIAARVTKEPLGQGRYKLLIFTWCGNMFTCSVDPWDAAIAFNRAVGAAGG